MKDKKSARGPRILRDLPPMDAEQIVIAAVRLTRQHGLDYWTFRQLAGELDCWPAVVYHHVGDRDVVIAAVVDRVVGMVPAIDGSLPWREAFRALLWNLRVALRMHPGVARWLALTGPVVPAMLAVIDRGVSILARAGLGAEAPAAYSVLINSAVLLIAIEDDRDTRPFLCEEIAQTLNLYRGSTDRRGLASMATACLDHWGAEDFYRYTVDRSLDGVEARMTVLRRNS